MSAAPAAKRPPCLLLTRPEGSNEELGDAIAERGWQAEVLPLLRVVPVEDVAARRARLEARQGDDWWIFTSRNAVRLVVAALPPPWSGSDAGRPRLAAVGAATAAALEAAGQPVAAVPHERYDSEALLALPELSKVAGQGIALLGNPEGRDTLRRTLTQRGAHVHAVPVYRLEALEHPPETVDARLAASDLILLTSGSAVERLAALCPPDKCPRLRQLPLVVPSERVAERARQAGLQGVSAVAQPMSPHALLAAADTLLAMEEKKTPERDTTSPSSGPDSPGAPPDAGSDTAAAAKVPAQGGGGGKSGAGEAKGGDGGAPSGRRGGRVLPLLLLLLVLLLAGAVAGAAWWGYQQIRQVHAEREALASLIEAERARVAENREQIAAASKRASEAQALATSLAEDNAAQDERIAELARIVDAGRERVHRLAALQLLQQASERLQLSRDVDGAAQALQLADQRLALLKDPRFLPVRERIAEERAALAAVATADRTAINYRLAALIDRANGLRLRGGVPDPHAPELPDRVEGEPEQAAWERVVDSVTGALSSVFVVRRTDIPVQPLMAPDQEPLVRGVLLLRLEAARVALLSGDEEGYTKALEAAGQWLDAQYATDDAPVRAAIEEVRALRQEPLSPSLPDISGSLVQLRKILRSVGAADGEPG